MTAEPAVLLERRDGVATVTLNRPDALNAMNAQLKEELAAAIAEIAEDDSVRAVLLCGNGRAFCAGGDITEMDPSRTPSAAQARQLRLLRGVFEPLAALPKPVVAAVHGHAHGGGVALALAADIVLVAQSTVLSLGFVQRGIAADCGIAYFLPRRVGVGRAKELLFTGRRFTPEEAVSLGIAERVVPDAELMMEASALATTLAGAATSAIAATKQILEQSMRLDFGEFAELEAFTQALTRSTADHREGVESFTEKRPAAFVGH